MQIYRILQVLRLFLLFIAIQRLRYQDWSFKKLAKGTPLTSGQIGIQAQALCSSKPVCLTSSLNCGTEFKLMKINLQAMGGRNWIKRGRMYFVKASVAYCQQMCGGGEREALWKSLTKRRELLYQTEQCQALECLGPGRGSAYRLQGSGQIN